MEQVPCAVNQTGYFFLAENHRQTLGALRVRQILLHVAALQHPDVEEPERGDMDHDGTVHQLLSSSR